MPTVEDNLKSEYERSGCALFKAMFHKEEFGPLANMLVAQLGKHALEEIDRLPVTSSLGDRNLNAAMVRLRRQNRKAFGLLYDAAQTSLPLIRLFADDRVVGAAAELLDADPAQLSVTDFMLRMDAPEDTRNTLAWHQDSSYFRQNRNGDHGLVCWIPLVEVHAANGSVIYLPGSHKEGRIDTPSRRDGPQSSEQFVIPDEFIEKYESARLVAEAGDAAFFHMDVIHRSGHNSSDCFRFNAGARFHRMDKDDFVPGRFVYEYSVEPA